jgi:uncharacterized lipoprotein YmbA
MATTRRWLLVAALPAACASPNPNLYTLASVPGETVAGAPRLIEVRSVATARYLERSQIVRSSDDYRLDVLGQDWWGEPLDAMLTRVLVQDLTQRLPGSTLFGENGSVSVSADATLGVNVQRLDQGADGAVILSGQISVSGGRGGDLARTLRLTAVPLNGTTAGLVAAMSAATGKLSDAAAQMLAGRGS